MPAAAHAPFHSARTSVPVVGLDAAAGNGVQRGRLPLPDRLIICKWGESRDLDGQPVIVNETTLSELAANQAQFGFDEVALDYSHNTTPKFDDEGNPIPPQEPQPVAAFGTLSVEQGVGIVWTPTSWTPEGEASYTGRHYRDLSPTVGKNEKGEVTFIHSVALTRQGQLAGLHAFSALTPAPIPSPKNTDPMDKTTDLDFRALACKMAGLSAECSDEELVAKASAVKPLACESESTPPTEGKAAESTPDLTALAATNARLDAIERENIVERATAAGKVIPLSADEILATPIATLKSMVEKIPATVPLSATTPSKDGKPALKPLSATEVAVCKNLRISEEDYRKANP